MEKEKNLLSVKALQIQLVPIALSSSLWLLVNNREPLSPFLSFKYWNTLRSLQSVVFYRVERPRSISIAPQWRFFNPLIIFVAILWTLCTFFQLRGSELDTVLLCVGPGFLAFMFCIIPTGVLIVLNGIVTKCGNPFSKSFPFKMLT